MIAEIALYAITHRIVTLKHSLESGLESFRQWREDWNYLFEFSIPPFLSLAYEYSHVVTALRAPKSDPGSSCVSPNNEIIKEDISKFHNKIAIEHSINMLEQASKMELKDMRIMTDINYYNITFVAISLIKLDFSRKDLVSMVSELLKNASLSEDHIAWRFSKVIDRVMEKKYNDGFLENAHLMLQQHDLLALFPELLPELNF